MEQKYLMDTNVLIDAQSGRFSQKTMEVLAKIIDRDFTISFITYN
jgi:predicted nucleic acid-binding protein